MSIQKRKTNTKVELKGALTKLLEEKNWESISVSDITRMANVNRGTFYLHYIDKYDMMDQLIEEISKNILNLLNVDNPKSKQDAFPAIVNIFSYLREEFDFLHALTVNQISYMTKIVHDFLYELTEKIDPLSETLESENLLPKDYATEVFIYSYSAIIFHWIKKGGIEEPEEVVKILFRVCI